VETTEKIVESYVRYIKRWATIPNIRCKGQFEIDLLAIDPVSLERYHIETSVSVSGGFSKLTAKPFDRNKLKDRIAGPQQRTTLGYFIERKFSQKEILETLKLYNFVKGKYLRVIVCWDYTDEADLEAQKDGVLLWRLATLMEEIRKKIMGKRAYFTDDTLRTLHLYALASDKDGKSKR